MIKREIKKAVVSQYFVVTILMITLAIIGDTIIRDGQSNIKGRFSWFDIEIAFKETRDPYMICHESGRAIMGFYLFAFIASFAVIKLCGDESETAYMNIVVTREGFFKYIVSKFMSVYVVGMLTIVLAYVLSFVCAHFIFGMPLNFDITIENLGRNGMKGTRFYYLFYSYRGWIPISLILLKKSLYIALWATVTLALSVYLKDRSLSLFISATVIILYDCIIQMMPKTVIKCMSENSIFMGDGVEELPYEGIPLHISIIMALSVFVFFIYAFGVHRRLRNG